MNHFLHSHLLELISAYISVSPLTKSSLLMTARKRTVLQIDWRGSGVLGVQQVERESWRVGEVELNYFTAGRSDCDLQDHLGV